MNEVTKLYENVGVKPINFAKQGAIDFTNTIEIDGKRYPDFTAEKLINLEMFLINKGDFGIKKGRVDITFESFTSCIAGLINNLWQDLTEEECKQVKGILE